MPALLSAAIALIVVSNAAIPGIIFAKPAPDSAPHFSQNPNPCLYGWVEPFVPATSPAANPNGKLLLLRHYQQFHSIQESAKVPATVDHRMRGACSAHWWKDGFAVETEKMLSSLVPLLFPLLILCGINRHEILTVPECPSKTLQKSNIGPITGPILCKLPIVGKKEAEDGEEECPHGLACVQSKTEFQKSFPGQPNTICCPQQ